ncbi:hypothetical protein TNCV_2106011 [Trichonephila clavipes]|nr:hypothetical protein TNCV_2106011 [Trichonephila clavipes]
MTVAVFFSDIVGLRSSYWYSPDLVVISRASDNRTVDILDWGNLRRSCTIIESVRSFTTYAIPQQLIFRYLEQRNEEMST